MSSEWKQLTLGDVTTWSSGGTPKKDIEAYWNGDIPWISANSMHGTRFSDSDLKITEAGLKNGSRLAERNSILLLVRGGALHSRIPVGIAMRDVAFNQDVKSLKAKEEFISPWFLLFWLMAHERFLLDSVVEYTGIGAGKLDTKRMQSLPFLVPPQEEMIAIEQIAKSIDERINLLRETNATLEAIAQALFKSWFVDFDPVHANAAALENKEQAPSLPPEIQALFPATFTDSPQGQIPEGWNVGAIKLACQKVESGGTPKRSVPEYWSGDIPWLSSGEVRNPIVLDTKETISQLGVKESSAKIWPAGSTIVAMYGATAGEVCILAKSSTANQACCGLIPKSNTRSFVFFCIRRESENLAAKSSGSAQQNLNKGLVESHEVIQPTSEVLTAFEDRMGALLDSWIENEKKAQTLSSLRDTLLPRLISGQLRLPEAEQAISAITD